MSILDFSKCPECGGDQLDGDSFETNDNEASQDVWCLGCDTAWVEVYVAKERMYR